ncbi:hypothetical protein DERF_014307 [Dermatophagoides farinae]|uniref:Uncharacterized protein n=1 Tax=Dermatophagoides farinae TaxID=6954 RepID=A0A922HHW2_DERFA|nr:hypothetical protein DERF_014307 [Dermatophagoides farinae]
MSDDFEHQMNGPEIDDYDATFKNEQFTVLSDSLTYLVDTEAAATANAHKSHIICRNSKPVNR